jgi:hypothetical protein
MLGCSPGGAFGYKGGGSTMKLTAATLEERRIRAILHQRVFEVIDDGLRRDSSCVQEIRVD